MSFINLLCFSGMFNIKGTFTSPFRNTTLRDVFALIPPFSGDLKFGNKSKCILM